MNLNELRQRFNIPGTAEVNNGKGNLPRLCLTTPGGDTAEVYLHGAHLTGYTPAGEQPVLFLSSASEFAPGKAIRGGVPICFPAFADNAPDPMPKHGFVRTAPWQLQSIEPHGDKITATLQLSNSDATLDLWPHPFTARFSLTVGPTLEMALTVSNPGRVPITYEQALHTYFRVGDAAKATVTGLEDIDYLDKTDGGQRKTQPDEPIAFGGEIDRAYLDTMDTAVLHDPEWQREIHVTKAGSRATVVWNIGPDKAPGMADLGPDQWKDYVCIETANVQPGAVTVLPDRTHTLTATVRVEPM